jgi:hypothetical protein
MKCVGTLRGGIDMSKIRLADKLTKLLVGSEKLAPEIQSSVRKYVSETGRIDPSALGKRRLMGDILIGQKGSLDAVKARYAQGGMLGPGGLVRGELALDPKFKELVKNFKASKGSGKVLNPYSGELVSKSKATQMLATKGIGQGINPLFLLGFPISDIKSSLDAPSHEQHGGASGVLGALGSGLGFAAAAPLGLVGGIGASMLGEHLGSAVGSGLDPTAPLLNLATTNSTRLPRASDVILDATVPR